MPIYESIKAESNINYALSYLGEVIEETFYIERGYFI